MGGPEQTQAGDVGARVRALLAGAEVRRGWLVPLALAVLATALYLPYALDAGFFLDDWIIYASYRDAGSDWEGIANCFDDLGHRYMACAYHGVAYAAFGDHHLLYHLWSIALVVAGAWLAYSILVTARVPWPWAALVALLVVTYPASDAARLWPVGAIGSFILVTTLAAIRIALLALATTSRRRAIALHVLAALLALYSVWTYEFAIPLIACAGIVYVAAYGWRRGPVARGALDVAIAGGYTLYRSADPYEQGSFVAERTLAESIDFLGILVRESGRVWTEVFTGGVTGTLLLAAAVLIAVVIVLGDATARRRVRPFAGLVVLGVLLGAVAIAVYVRSPNYYIPGVHGTANRVNLGAMVPGAMVFLGALGIIATAAARLRVPLVGAVVVALGVGYAAYHGVGIERDHQAVWLEAWRQQETALEGYADVLRDVPEGARIVGFDVPLQERGPIPVFGTSWDLKGAIDYISDVEPVAAWPAAPDVQCTRDGVLWPTNYNEVLRYEDGPWFISPARREALQVDSREECQTIVDTWGHVPPWGRSVTEPGAI